MTQFIRVQTTKFSFLQADIIALLFVVFFGFACVHFVQIGNLPYHESPVIDTSFSALPGYALLSFVRSLIALFISYVFAICYGTLAAKKSFEKILIPLLDVLQSLPVIAFLPGFVLALISIFNNSRWGLEIACIITIFFGQVWNLVFAYYESKVTIKKEYSDATKVFQLNVAQRFLLIDLPNSARPLIYNGMISMAGGWFFLTTSEAFTIGQKDFQIPGLGSYIAASFARGETSSFVAALFVLFFIIVGTNIFLWQPLVAWVNHFYHDPSDKNSYVHSWFLDVWRETKIFSFFGKLFEKSLSFILRKPVDQVDVKFFTLITLGTTHAIDVLSFSRVARFLRDFLVWLRRNISWIATFLVGGAFFSFYSLLPSFEESFNFIAKQDWLELWKAVGITGIRVLVVLIISTLWTLPLGLFLGLNPKFEKFCRPIIQNLAAFPIPVLFPLLAILMLKANISENFIAIALMCNGCQWYILFNVVGGASRIVDEFKFVSNVYRFSLWKKLKMVYFPAVLPSLVTGWMSAAGGAWNASMLAEIVVTPKGIIHAGGIGAELTISAAEGNYSRLIAGVICIVVALILINILLWRQLSRYSQKTFES